MLLTPFSLTYPNFWRFYFIWKKQGNNFNVKRAKKIEKLYNGLKCDDFPHYEPQDINNSGIDVYLFDNSCYTRKKERHKSFCYFFGNINVIVDENNIYISQFGKEIKDKGVIKEAEKLADKILEDLVD